jgi:hypothetical protein
MLRNRTLKVALLFVLGIGTIVVGLARAAPIASQNDADTQAKIANALSAGPSAIADQATILDYEMDDAGQFVVLREGSNDWSCFPDFPGGPIDDPMCLDATWLAWLYAMFTGEEPNVTVPGIAYMLQGSSDASNTDPFATEPAAGEDWVIGPPHLMIIVPEELDQSVFSTDHASGGAWIMFPGTPYEHVMMPVAAGEHGM